jgi:hypothetical protein
VPDLEQDYLLLDVGTDSTPEQIRESYLLLLQVWHPDRFTGKPRLAAKATAKAQQLNAAFARIKTAPLRHGTSGPSPSARIVATASVGRPAPDVETIRKKLRAICSSEGWQPTLVEGARTVTLDCESCGVARQYVLMEVASGLSVSPPIFRMFMKKPWWSSQKGYFLVCSTCADAFTCEKDLADKLIGRA